MADNYTVRDSTGAVLTIKSKDTGAGVQVPQSVPTNADGTPISQAAPLDVRPGVTRVTFSDRSGTLTATTSTQIAAANAARIGFWVQNLSTTLDLWVNITGTSAVAGPGSILIPPMAVYEIPVTMLTTAAISVIGAIGQTYTAKEC